MERTLYCKDSILSTAHYYTTTLHTVQCTLHITHCTQHTAHMTLLTSHFTLHNAHFKLTTAHCTQHTLHFILQTAHWTLHKVYSAYQHFTKLFIQHYIIYTTLVNVCRFTFITILQLVNRHRAAGYVLQTALSLNEVLFHWFIPFLLIFKTS